MASKNESRAARLNRDTPCWNMKGKWILNTLILDSSTEQGRNMLELWNSCRKEKPGEFPVDGIRLRNTLERKGFNDAILSKFTQLGVLIQAILDPETVLKTPDGRKYLLKQVDSKDDIEVIE
jgi:hypothetical protein